MTKFSPTMLVPAAQVSQFAKAAGQRTVQQVALDNINRMREQFQAGDAAEGKRNFKVSGDRVAFTIRVNNTALTLERVAVPGSDVPVEVREMTVPTANFLDGLAYYADRIKVGEYQAQLEALGGKREARTSKMRETRAAKKEASPA